MRLQRQIALKQARKTYYKYVIILPTRTVEKLGWKDGTELITQTKNGRLTLRPL